MWTMLAALACAVVGSELARRAEQSRTRIEAGKAILPHRIWSKASQKPKSLIVFLHGWPDDCNVFENIAAKLADRYCCASCNLPGYPLPPNFDGNLGSMPERKWGFSFTEAVDALKSTIDKLVSEGGFDNVTLITHDWGAFIGYILDDYHPGTVQRMVSLDVGLRSTVKLPGLLFAVSYQGFLNICFMLPTPIGSFLTSWVSKLLKRKASLTSGPVSNLMNWPYRAAWHDLFTNGGVLRRVQKCSLSAIPRLFIYAKETPESVRFSDEDWYKKVENSVKGVSKVVAVRGGHWMLVRNEEEVTRIIQDWLTSSQSSTPLLK